MTYNTAKPTGYVTTAEARISFPNVFTPKETKHGPRYGCVLLFDKKTGDLAAIKQIVNEMRKKVWGDKPQPPAFKIPIKDGDVPNGQGNIPAGFAGCWVVPCTSKNRPTVVDQSAVNEIIDARKLYAGCFVRASVNAFEFNTDGNRGISIGLSSLQLVREGERLGGGGGPAPSQAFQPVPGSASAGNGDDMADLLGDSK